MNESPEGSEQLDSDAVDRGRNVVVAVIVVAIAAAVLIQAEYLIWVGTNKLPQQMLRNALTLLLLFLLYRGHGWAKYVLAVLFGVGALFGMVALPRMIVAGNLNVDLLLLLTAAYAWAAVVLIKSSSVGEFQRFQRDQRRRQRR